MHLVGLNVVIMAPYGFLDIDSSIWFCSCCLQEAFRETNLSTWQLSWWKLSNWNKLEWKIWFELQYVFKRNVASCKLLLRSATLSKWILAQIR